MDAKKTPDRKSTDHSLDEERNKTDSELAKKRTIIEEDADDVVRTARRRADAVLRAARDAADHPLAPERTGERSEQARAHEDAAVRSERASEDQTLEGERLARSQALAELFRLERDQTDLDLLTERARSDDALNKRDTFLAMVSHDLRTMLHGIAMTAAMLVKDNDAERRTSVRARAEMIQRSAARMNRLVGDLVDVATVETGRPLVRPEGRDLLRLLREANEGLQPVVAAHRIVFISEIIGQPLVAAFDHDRILQVLANIITNAIKFTHDGGRIVLRVEAHEGKVRFSVHDTGAGIPSDKLEAIFERFWQVGRPDRRGLGLGLYISKCIIEGHGGRIWAESTIGKGTTIFFTLPQAEKAAAPF